MGFSLLSPVASEHFEENEPMRRVEIRASSAKTEAPWFKMRAWYRLWRRERFRRLQPSAARQ